MICFQASDTCKCCDALPAAYNRVTRIGHVLQWIQCLVSTTYTKAILDREKNGHNVSSELLNTLLSILVRCAASNRFTTILAMFYAERKKLVATIQRR